MDVYPTFGEGAFLSLRYDTDGLFVACLSTLFILAMLSALSGLRRKWLGLLATALLLSVVGLANSTVETVANLALLALVLFLLTRVGLLAAVGCFLGTAVINAPPLVFSQWYVGRALMPLVSLIALLFYSFYISMGSQPMFGKVLEDGAAAKP